MTKGLLAKTDIITNKKRVLNLCLELFIKNGDDLLSHKPLQYHRRCWA